MTFITVAEASEKWNISTRRICVLCTEGRIPGAVKKSRIWMIPKDAQKPDDARKTDTEKGMNPILLVYNPTYFEIHSIEPGPEEKSICDIQDKFLKGHMKEAYEELVKKTNLCRDDKYLDIYFFLKSVYGTDLGEKTDLERMPGCLENFCGGHGNSEQNKAIIDYYTGKFDFYNDNYSFLYLNEDIQPLICLIMFRKIINRVLQNRYTLDLTALEIICKDTDKKDCPLISAYLHLFLAIYYNVIGAHKMFEFHYGKALDILLPRKWYTPLAEYAATIDLKYVAKIDEEAYKSVSELSNIILEGYVKSGLFENIVEQPKMKSDINIQVAYKMAQGKSVEEIATEMGLS